MSRTYLPNPSQSRIILTGAYLFDKLESLPAVKDNLRSMAELITDPAIWGIPADRCVIVEQPSSVAELLDPIYEAGEDCTDTLLFYYAGHGLISPHGDDLLLALPTTDVRRPYTSVRFDDVRAAILSNYRTSNKLVILDCCFSGRAMAGQMSDRETLASRSSIEGTYLLTAAAETKTALAPPGEMYTAFTGELIGLLRKGIQQGPKLLDLDTIYDHLKVRLTSKGRPVPQQRNRNDGARIALGRNISFRQTRPPANFDIEEGRRKIHALHLSSYERLKAVESLAEHAPEYTEECIAAVRELIHVSAGHLDAIRGWATIARISAEHKPEAARHLIAFADGSVADTPTARGQACAFLKELGAEYRMDSVNGYRDILSTPDFAYQRIAMAEEFAEQWPEFADEILAFLWPLSSDENPNRKERIDALRCIANIDPSTQDRVNTALKEIFVTKDVRSSQW